MRDEKGVVFLLALLFLGILLLLGTALLGLSVSEHQVAVSHRDGVQALYLADLGIEKAKSELNKRLDADTTKVDFDTELTTNNAYLFGAASGAYVTFSVGPDIGTYQVKLENNTPPNPPPHDPGGATDDQDKTVWAESKGVVTIQGHIRRKTVRALLGPVSLAAFTMGCDATGDQNQNTFTLSGNPNILGSMGNLHSNCDLRTTGITTVAEDITAVGTLNLSASTTNGGIRDDDAPLIPLPVVNPLDFRPLADYILRFDGKVFQRSGGTETEIYDADVPGGGVWPGNPSDSWKWNKPGQPGASPEWVFSGSIVHASLENKAFYFEKDPAPGTHWNNVSISGNPPTGGTTWKVSVIAEGYIDISGSPNVGAADGKQNLLFVAGSDIKIGGSLTSTFVGGGVLAAHEQISVSGDLTITGLLLAENASHLEPLVTATSVSGNPNITYNGLPTPPGIWRLPIVVKAWKEIP